jgi:hypothetical protein
MNEILEKVKQYADEAHGSQMRKYTKQRYIVHPIQVMEICSEYTSDLCVLAAALLHDVLEDTPTTRADLEAFLLTIMNAPDAKRTTDLTVELTDVYTKEAYPQYNRRVRKDKEHVRGAATSPSAQTIKYADIISNSIDVITHDKDFSPKFLKEVGSQLKSMNKGNAALYARAVATVDECSKKM